MVRRRWPQNPDETEIDSVALEFGNEYSEDTLNILRGIQKPPYLEETSSLDPIDDLDLYVEHGLSIPPKAYDALQEAGQQNIKDLQAAKEYVADPAVVDSIRYRQALAQGATNQDMTWLKLRAYHRAMDELSAANTKEQAEDKQELLQAYDVPTDKVPADLLSMQPEQLAERRRLALQAKAVALARARKSQSATQRILAQPDPSEESEWVPAQNTRSALPDDAKLGLLQAVFEHQGCLDLVPRQVPGSIPKETAPDADGQQPAKQVLGGRTWEKRTIYTQAYLDQIALSKRVRQQQRQRTTAFWFSFAAVSGACVLRFLRHRKKGRKLTSKQATSKLQPQPSVTGSGSSRQQL